MDYTLMVFVGSLMNIFVLDRQVRVFFDKRRTRFPVFALSFLFYFVLINVTFWLGFHPRTSMLIWFASRIVVSLNYEGSWKKRIIASISFTAIAGILDLTIMRLFGFYYASFFHDDLVHNFLSMTVTSLITFIAALGLQKFPHLKKDVIASPGILAFLFVIPLSSIVLAFFLAVTTNPTTFGGILTSAIIFGINVIVFYLHDRLSAAHARNLEAVLYEREKDYYLAQIRTMQESEERARAVRHDIKSHWATLKGLAGKIDAGEITDYLDALFDGAADPETRCDTGNVAIDSVVNYKLKNAERDGIGLDLDLRVPRDLNVDAPDLAAILGNLLDNALEAVARVEDKRISLEIEYARRNLLIRVENTFDGEIVQTRGRGAAEGRLLSRKPGGGHGLGLRNVRRALEKYDGHLEIAHGDGVFTAKVLLYVTVDIV